MLSSQIGYCICLFYITYFLLLPLSPSVNFHSLPYNAHTMILLFCLGDAKDLSYYFGCETKLKAASVPRLEIAADIQSSSGECETAEAKAMRMLQLLLAQQGRCLTPGQWKFVAQPMAVEPTALYVRLALRVVGKLLEHK